jgi:hypothetical protein
MLAVASIQSFIGPGAALKGSRRVVIVGSFRVDEGMTRWARPM